MLRNVISTVKRMNLAFDHAIMEMGSALAVAKIISGAINAIRTAVKDVLIYCATGIQTVW